VSSSIYEKSFVLYESVYRTFKRLYDRDPSAAAEYINAVLDFGIEEQLPDEESDVWLYGLDSAIAAIDSAKNNRKKNIGDGSKGGRPQINLDQEEVLARKQELKTWKAVAESYGISEDTLRNIRHRW
jgi:hypothetical protein